METIGSKRSYALIWCMPNNDDDDDLPKYYRADSSPAASAVSVDTVDLLFGWTGSRKGIIQDSIAIAKTARCAQYMGALKSFQSPHYAHGYFCRNL